MTVASITTATPGTVRGTVPAPNSSGTLDTNAFLRLLVAELQNQDPTKPMDSTQLVAQLASFAQVEQATATNVKLASVLDALAIGQATGLVGRTIDAADGATSGTVAAVRITAEGLVAQLAGGGEIVVGQGVTVRP